ncbi:MAG: phosphoribosylglycinamide formyltransferase [Lautropia sp.]|nr:phosphoribosylglycinamide formyltransferase [Lautropia sp.]
MSVPAAAPVRAVILISGRGSNMMALVESIERDGLPVEVAGVISNRPDAAGLAWAAERGMTCRVVDHRSFADRAAFDRALGDAIDALVPPADQPLVLLAGFMRVLTAGFVQRFDRRLVNIHPSLLPALPGLHTHRKAIEAGAVLHGATVHLVTAEVDHGPIIAQALVPVLADDTEDALARRVLTMEHRLFPLVLDWLSRGRISVDARGRVLLDGEDRPARRTLLHPSLVA